MQIKKILLFLTISSFFLACNDDFLERSSETEVFASGFWKSENDATQAILGVYTHNATFRPEDWMVYIDGMSDNATIVHTFNPHYAISLGTHDATNRIPKDIWNYAYRGIRLVNDVLINVDNINATDTFKTSIKAEARFMRAWYYQRLITVFGDVPYFEQKVTIEDENFDRMPVEQVLQNIISDLDFAIANLPSNHDGVKSRATANAAYALKSRVLLFYEDYQESYTAAQNVIGSFELFDNFEELFLTNNESNEEVIWEQEYLADVSGNNLDVFYAPVMLGGWTAMSPLQSLVDEFETTDGLTIDDSGSIYDSANPWDNRDPRMKQTILFHGDMLDGLIYDVTSGSQDRIGGGNATRSGYALRKFYDPATKNGSNGSGRNFPVIRYAEVLLTYAEAKIEANSIDQSVLDAINEVRARAYGTTAGDITNYPAITTMDQNELREIVRRERRVELAFEGFRFYDIRRWRTAEFVMNGPVYGYNPSNNPGEERFTVETRQFRADRDYLLPIPNDEIDLTGLEQNPNY